jgi:hypothetical protein
MNLPFTVDQFLDLFQDYNPAIWPMQVVAYVLGITAVAFVFIPSKLSSRFVSAVLAFFWLWNGIVYHLLFFAAINPLAYGFAAAFVLQGILFFTEGALKPDLTFRFKPDVYSFTGLVFLVYGMVAYPLLGTALGHGYPKSPAFGLAPCPTGIFTFGLLMLVDGSVPRHLLIIPFLWSAIGFFAAVSLGITEDIGLLVAGVLGSLMIIYREQKTTVTRLRKAKLLT